MRGAAVSQGLTNYVKPTEIPQELRERHQWVIWKHEPGDSGKITKVPYQARIPNRRAASTSSATWCDFDTAHRTYLEGKTITPHGEGGIGYVFSADDPYCGFDADDCIDPETSKLTPWASERLKTLSTYAELSVSGTGVHAISKAVLPGEGKGRKTSKGEIYDRGRFFAFTGHHLVGTPKTIEMRQAQVEAIYNELGPLPKEENAAPRDTPPLDLQDEEVLELARNAKNGAKFRSLYDHGDTSAYAANGVHEGRSEADFALCCQLRFWVGNDAARIDRLFKGSKLYREKWNKSRGETTYGELTINEVIDRYGHEDSYTPRGEGVRATFTQSSEEPELLAYLRTDYGNAERLVAQHGRDIRFCAALGWLVWDGQRWVIDKQSQQGKSAGPVMMRRALETARELYKQTGKLDDIAKRQEWGKHALKCETKAQLENAVALAKSVPGISIKADELDADPMLLNVLNGTLDLKTGRLREHRREDLITKLAPVTFDPSARCPIWTDFQRTICNKDDELVRFKQRAAGYSMTGKTVEDVLLVAFGAGANGKSTEMTAYQNVLGDYASTAQFTTFTVQRNDGVRDDVADLAGARFISASEGESRHKLAEGLVKQLTGGDPIKARHLYHDYFTFTPTFKIWLATNHKPRIEGTDYGIWRRVRLIPYTVTISAEEQDKRLREKLESEASGILNWMLQGCLEWQRRGLGTAKAVDAATKKYKDESDALASFLISCCQFDELYSEPSKDLYESYETWCEENRPGDEPLSMTAFGRLLAERGYLSGTMREGGKVIRVRHGLKLNESGEEDQGGGE